MYILTIMAEVVIHLANRIMNKQIFEGSTFGEGLEYICSVLRM